MTTPSQQQQQQQQRSPSTAAHQPQHMNLTATDSSSSSNGCPAAGAVKMVAGYALQERLGSGSFATVYMGRRVAESTGLADTVAIKAISRTSDKLTKKVLENLELEINILRTYRHPNIVCLHEVHKTERHFYLMLEYCAGGDLQHLIRSREAGRLTESLTRRLMRDLTAGLRFLRDQQLIHRDIKPQNLLLTGPLPLDEIHDPCKSDSDAEARRIANFPTEQYHLKIADFGFARHLQTASLAETLCGSPLYMAPEILQHHRYDAKADLWSAGTVLFEMIAGRPPFHGENHIDLLRNIQRKAVRLPPDVRVSKECVNLLRLLLNRNPLSRAGFSDFFVASNAFVALGCNGVELSVQEHGKAKSGPSLGSISEAGEASAPGAASMDSIATYHAMCSQSQPRTDAMDSPQSVSSNNNQDPNSQFRAMTAPSNRFNPLEGDGRRESQFGNDATLLLGPRTMPHQPHLTPPMDGVSNSVYSQHQEQHQIANYSRQYSHFAPLEPSPPGPKQISYAEGFFPPPLNLGSNNPQSQQSSHPQVLALSKAIAPFQQEQQQFHHRLDSSQYSDDGGFVMVEHGGNRSSGSNSLSSVRFDDSQQQRQTLFSMWKHPSSKRSVVPTSCGSVSPPASPISSSPRFSINLPGLTSRALVRPSTFQSNRGMLSTSPSTGGTLVGMMGTDPYGTAPNTGFTTGIGQQYQAQEGSLNMFGTMGVSHEHTTFDIDFVTKMLAAAEDVGRRAVNVAHLGDTRAFLAMKFLMANDGGLSLLASTPMEGVEEEDEEHDAGATENENDSGSDTSSSRTFPMGRRRAVSADRSASQTRKDDDDDDDDEMPFAVTVPRNDSNASLTPVPLRQQCSTVSYGSSMATSKLVGSPPVSVIQVHFREALSCYVKALFMLKSSVNASQKVLSEVNGVSSLSSVSPGDSNTFASFKKRCELSHSWLSGQFAGVLERADAASTEIAKFPNSDLPNGETAANSVSPANIPVTSVEELIYSHSLAYGRDGAVKQLLGQYEAARSCYRSAGLLSEALLMEPNLEEEDRNVLKEYVNGFAERITELDSIMLHQSRQGVSSTGDGIMIGPLYSESNHSRRGSGVIGIVGGMPPPTSTDSPF